MVRFLSSGPRGRGQIRRDAKAKVSMETSRSDRLKDRISNLKAALAAKDKRLAELVMTLENIQNIHCQQDFQIQPNMHRRAIIEECQGVLK